MHHTPAHLQGIRDLGDLASGHRNALATVDPRAQIIASLAFILAVVSFDRYAIAGLLPLLLFPVVMAVLGDVPLRQLCRKLLIASPFAVMVGLFNPLFDQTPVIALFGISISGGWVSFASILLRFGLTVAAALILVSTAGFQNLCHGLMRLGVPRVFVTQLLFLHRYSMVLGSEAARMSLAHELRSSGKRNIPLKVYASLLGHLLLRALDRAQRLHWAMLSRGFAGQIRVLQPLPWRTSDSVFLAISLAGILVARQTDLVHALGTLIVGGMC